jgi:hypothetical protein
MSNASMPKEFSHLDFRLDLAFELWHLTFNISSMKLKKTQQE